MINSFLLFAFVVGNTFSNIDVELDVAFRDSTVNCRYLYVICNEKNDTLAVFDTLSFNGYDRVSLFYYAKDEGKNTIAMIDTSGAHLESNTFVVSPRRKVFSVVIDNRQINVRGKNYLYLILITALIVECLLIMFICRKSKSQKNVGSL